MRHHMPLQSLVAEPCLAFQFLPPLASLQDQLIGIHCLRCSHSLAPESNYSQLLAAAQCRKMKAGLVSARAQKADDFADLLFVI